MTSRDIAQAPHQYVLPFKASPEAIGELRRAVRAELGPWGLADLASETELVVTELATNVVRHVGEGSAAALVLEFRADVIRVEVHDASRQVPALAEVGCASECGRGLQLVSVIARDWGARVTTSGKAVWCDLSRPGGDGRVRAWRADLVLSRYRELAGTDAATLLSHPHAQEERATALIVDLLHWLEARNCDPDATLDRAQQRYEAGLEAAV
ncbi:ATP-binding protein [Streptomyces sp. NPDC060322]|uniref:ATP-binding protein n=1 Tax=Streptomyces sp. NPDC060322 TaxID=3347097 RepID=UPI003660FAF1